MTYQLPSIQTLHVVKIQTWHKKGKRQQGFEVGKRGEKEQAHSKLLKWEDKEGKDIASSLNLNIASS